MTGNSRIGASPAPELRTSEGFAPTVNGMSSDVGRGPAAPVVDPNVVAPPPPEWLPAPAVPEKRERRHLQRHWTVRLVLAPVVVGALLWPLLVVGGVDSAQAGRIAVVVGVQTLGGALLWRLVRGAVGVHLVELVGMGLAVGTLLSLLAQQVLRLTPLEAQAWWLPAAAAALLGLVLGLVPATRRRLQLGSDEPFGLDEAGGVGLGLGVGFLFVWLFWRAHPLAWSGWWAYYTDIPYHEALATSVTTWGPGDNILAVGSQVRYHWFADAWAGTTTAAAGAGPFVVITRLLPLVALLGTVCLVWAWGRRLSDSRAVPLLAVVLTTVALNIGSALPVDVMHLLPVSPSLAMGSVWLLGAALVFTEFVAGRLGWIALLPLAVLAVGCVGGKTSNVPALLGGIGLTALACLLRPGVRARVWAAFGVVLVASAGAFVALILGSAGNLTVQAGATAKVFHVLPNGSVLGVVVGTLGAVLVLATTWTGVAVLTAARETRGRPELWFGLGAALAGLVLMGGLGHPGASQVYFPLSAGVLVIVVSAWGLGEALRRMSSAALGIAVVVGVVAGAVSVVVGGAVTAAVREAAALHAAVKAARAVAGTTSALTSAVASAAASAARNGGSAPGPEAPALGTPLVVLSHGLTWLAPYAVWALPILLVVGAAIRARVRRVRYPRGGLLGVLAWAVVTASLVAGAVGVLDAARAPGPVSPAPHEPLAWTDMHRDALVWLREHSATDDVVATNRQCSSVQVPGHRCRGTQRWFLTAALTGRRMYVEGADYAISLPHPAWIDHRVQVSRRFVDAPTSADARTLYAAGVRWVVVDLASTPTRDWAPYADPMYTTSTTAVLRLLHP